MVGGREFICCQTTTGLKMLCDSVFWPTTLNVYVTMFSYDMLMLSAEISCNIG